MKVIALELGFDNVALRHPGDEFDMPDDSFDRRQRKDADGKVIEGLFYEHPPWFEPADPELKKKVDADRKAIVKANAAVPAINPGKQAADYEAQLKTLLAQNEALAKENEALLKGKK